MSKKPDGTNGKKSVHKTPAYKAKSMQPQKKAERIIALHASTGGKVMKVARGTARMLRRVGLMQGWRKLENAIQMQPAALSV